MLASLGGIVLGLLVGLRHAFEPDHLAAVSTMVTEVGDTRRGAILGVAWGLGHTISLIAVGIVLMVVGAAMPEHVAAALECGVSAMLILLGARAVVRSLRDGRIGPVATHRHDQLEHAHAAAAPHLHLGRRTLAWRPLAVGLVHGLAGSGALTALVFARLPGTAERIAYIALFGFGSIAGMAIASGLAGAAIHTAAASAKARRAMSLATGALAIVVGVVWAVPMVAILT